MLYEKSKMWRKNFFLPEVKKEEEDEEEEVQEEEDEE